jgi:hypothetical protein
MSVANGGTKSPIKTPATMAVMACRPRKAKTQFIEFNLIRTTIVGHPGEEENDRIIDRSCPFSLLSLAT